jgi:hypothetical protein
MNAFCWFSVVDHKRSTRRKKIFTTASQWELPTENDKYTTCILGIPWEYFSLNSESKGHSFQQIAHYVAWASIFTYIITFSCYITYSDIPPSSFLRILRKWYLKKTGGKLGKWHALHCVRTAFLKLFFKWGPLLLARMFYGTPYSCPLWKQIYHFFKW